MEEREKTLLSVGIVRLVMCLAVSIQIASNAIVYYCLHAFNKNTTIKYTVCCCFRQSSLLFVCFVVVGALHDCTRAIAIQLACYSGMLEKYVLSFLRKKRKENAGKYNIMHSNHHSHTPNQNPKCVYANDIKNHFTHGTRFELSVHRCIYISTVV